MARPARISAAMASATWRRTGKGVAQSLCNLVTRGVRDTAADRTVILIRGMATGLGDRRQRWKDPTAGDVAAVTVMVLFVDERLRLT